jgi:molecular chaperone DnaK
MAIVNNHGKATILANAEGQPTTPSVVHFYEQGACVVGEEAVKSVVADPANSVQFIKRLMGQDGAKFLLYGDEFTPQALSALILKKLREDAEEALSIPIRQAVITVPAYFNSAQRAATAEAGRLAGLDVLSMINEPTAAAIAYGLEHFGEDRRMLVFDLGGGTFDVTIMDIEGITFRTVASDGNAELGGKDWDDRIVDFAAALFQAQFASDPRDDPQSYQELYERCVGAKLALSTKPRAVIPINHGGNRTVIELSREQFEGLTTDLVNQCAETCSTLLSRHDLDWADIDEVLLVGGSTRMPMIRDLVKTLAGNATTPAINPDECVAIGAALAAVLRHKPAHPALRTVRARLKERARQKQMEELEAAFEMNEEPEDATPPSDESELETSLDDEPAFALEIEDDEEEGDEPEGNEPASSTTEVEAQFDDIPAPPIPPDPTSQADTEPTPPAPPPIMAMEPAMLAKNEGPDAERFETEPIDYDEMDDVTDPGIPAVKIADACTHPLGVVVLDEDLNERIVTLIDAATPVPCERRGRFAYAYDGMTAVSVQITEGRGETPDDVTLIGQIVLDELPARPRGTPIDVVYRYNEDQILEVDVVDVETAAVRSVQVNLTGALDSDALFAAAQLVSDTHVR